ncbi:hypothetical protein VTO73DRAFT_4329 [Trametes versicolor]
MNAPWLYRVITFVLASILSLVVIVFCVKSKDHLDDIVNAVGGRGQFNASNYPYATLGIAVGVMTVVSKVAMLALDFFFESIFTSYIIFELGWSCVLWVLWIAVGGTTLSNGKDLFGDENCQDFHVILPEAEDACDDIHPIASIAFVTFALFFLYSGVLVFLAFSGSGWNTSLRSRTK